MREIKFRAWDEIKQKMVKVGEMRWETDGTFIGGGDTWYTKFATAPAETFTNNIMQFTGLKDKNGVEIYFGDILQTSNSNPEFDIWTSDDYGYSVCYEDPEELGVRFKNWTPTTEEESIYNFQFVEVIGNIYQNPELLAEAEQKVEEIKKILGE